LTVHVSCTVGNCVPRIYATVLAYEGQRLMDSIRVVDDVSLQMKKNHQNIA